MSNQVYQNNNDKFLEMPGYNIYNAQAIGSIAQGATGALIWSTNTRIVDNGKIITTSNVSPGNITLNSAGVYAININLVVTSGATGTVNIGCTLYDNTYGGTLFIESEPYTNAAGLSINKSFSYVGAFPAGQLINAYVSNSNTGSNTIDVSASTTLEITKIY